MRSRTRTCGHADAPRRGTVILAVLVVVVVLALAAYKYSGLMLAEYQSAGAFLHAGQARAMADSGIHYAAAALSSPDTITNTLGGNPFNAPSVFQSHAVQGTGSPAQTGYFSIVSPGSPDTQASGGSSFCFGVMCEAGKINLNGVMKLDKSGNTLYAMLMQLPNMSDYVANSIVYWLDQKAAPRSSGADNNYYGSLNPPYQAKNNFIDSLDELLLVAGVTPQLLYGNDRNRNGMIDPDEDNSSGLGAGWSSFLTVSSRELNVDSQGNPRVYVNDQTLQNILNNVPNVVNQDMATFILLYRIYGGTTLPKGSNITAQPVSGFDPSTLDLSSKKGSNQVSSLYDLINSYVSVPNSDPKKPPTYYASPLNDQSQQAQLLPKVLDELTTSQGQYVYGRINVNTASQEVINALGAIPQPSQGATVTVNTGNNTTTVTTTTNSNQSQGQSQNTILSASDVQNIIGTQPQVYQSSSIDQSYQTPAWLMTQAGLSASKMKQLEKYITTRSQVYRVQSVGYVDGVNGPFVRLEAIIDANGGQPRILSWRDLSELGKAFNLQTNGQ